MNPNDRPASRFAQESRYRRIRLEALEQRTMLDAYPLGDIETNRSAWEGKSWGTLDGEVIFASENGIYGREIWATDGTESGTRLVRDIYPGSGSSLSASQDGTRVDDLLLFQASDGVHGLQLWKTDGSTAGTSSVADWLEEPGLATARLFAQTDAALYLSVETADVMELWSTDGTPAGTHHLANGPTAGWAIQLLGVVGNTLLFGLDDGEHGYEVWRTDGSPEGTFLLRDIAEGAASSTRTPHDFLGVYDGAALFMASNAEFGAELWRTDGTTEGTQVLIDASPGTASSSLAAGEPLAVTSFGLFFWLRSNETGAELYRTDGTTTGTELLKDIRPGTSGSLRAAEAVAVADSWVAFTADDGVDRDALWITDGSGAGTFKLQGAPQGGELQALLSAELLGSIDSRIVFTVKGDFGREVWSTDGTIAGTQSLGELNAERKPFGVLDDGSILFVSQDTVFGQELWRTTGTPEGTVRVSDICPGACEAQLWSGALGWLGDQLYFSAYDPAHGKELWAIDRWGGNLRRVVDAIPGADSLFMGFQSVIATVGPRLLFEGTDETHGSEIWYTDGTAAGTGLLRDFVPGPDSGGASHVNLFAALSDRVLLRAPTEFGFGLWETDGTPDGTRPWQDFRSGNAGSNPQDLIAANGQVFFNGFNREFGSQLWALPGTGGEPFSLADHTPTYYGDSLKSVAELDGWLYFVNLEQGGAPLLYRTQGTSASTTLVAVLSPGDGAVARTRRELVTVGERLFIAVQSDSPNEGYGALWSSDGTAAGTVRLGLGQFVSVDELTPVGDRLFFTANRGGGPELWVTDGSPAGTRKLKDLCSPRNCTGRFGLTEANGNVYFASNDHQYGMELWRSDGTPEGMSLVANIGSGVTSGLSLENTRSMASLNGDLYFAANDGPNGFEPWVLRAGAAAPTMLADLRPGLNGHSFLNGVTGQFTPVGDWMYFLSRDGLWKTSADSPTPVLVKSANVARTWEFAVAVDALYFVPDFSIGSFLWRTDGTVEGTTQVQFVDTNGPSAIPAAAPEFAVLDDTLYFLPKAGAGVWKTDGTLAGTREAFNLPAYDSGCCVQKFDGFTHLYGFAGRLFVTSSEITNAPASPPALYVSDGTQEATEVFNQHFAGSHWMAAQYTPNNPALVAALPGGVLFLDDDSFTGNELRFSDGTIQGTRTARDIDVGRSSLDIGAFPASDEPTRFPVVNGDAYFVFNQSGLKLARVDGDSAEIETVARLVEPEGALLLRDSWIWAAVPFGEKVAIVTIHFVPSDISLRHAMTAWTYDPSNGQLVQLSSDELIRAGYPPFLLRLVAGTDSIFYGVEWQDQGGRLLSLRASDGTAEGTRRLDQRLTANGSFLGLESLGELGVYIVDGAVWLRDSNTDGVTPAPLAPGAPDYRLARDLTVVAGRVYFSAISDEHGRELWVFDGQQVRLVADIYPGPASSAPAELAAYDGALYFSADDGTHGAELWTVPAGDEAAPQLLRDVVPGPAASRPAEFLKVGDDLLFSAEDGVLGRELWREAVWLPGDADGDGRVGLTDLNLVRNHFGLDSAQRFHGDLDGNGVVDLGDLNAVRNHFGATLASATTGGARVTQGDFAAGSFAKAADFLFMHAASQENRSLKRPKWSTGR